MDDYESFSHTKWECKYHAVFIRDFAHPARRRPRGAEVQSRVSSQCKRPNALRYHPAESCRGYPAPLESR